MELTLTPQNGTQIAVACDDQPSHTFDFLTLTPDEKIPGRPPQPLEDPVVYGQAVFAALFPADSPARRKLDEQTKRIVIVTERDDLQFIPWEYAHDGQNFLVTQYPFVRALPKKQRMANYTPTGGLYITAVPSNPLDKQIAQLNIEGEWGRLRENIEEIPLAVTLERVRPPTAERLSALLAEQRDRVVHFMGHGGEGKDGAALIFEKEDGGLEAISASDFIQHVGKAAFLVTLNACISATPGATEFSNLAAALAARRIPYALGMRFSIVDSDARDFSKVFYEQLARGVAVETALKLARLRLAKSDRKWAVGVPVLYTALDQPAPGFARAEGQPKIIDELPPMDVTAIPRAEAFQGRADALRALGTALTGDDRPRVVTIHAVGGQGKTALAREAVERFAWAWPGGVWAYTLENLPTRETIVNSLARFLSIDPESLPNTEAVEKVVVVRLRARRTLLVLDNAETLTQAIANKDENALAVANFFRETLNGTRAGLLVTSRETLGWAGEFQLDLNGLTDEEGAILFFLSAPSRRREIDLKLAAQLSDKVDGHPLSLRLLASAFDEIQTPLAEIVHQYDVLLDKAVDKYKGDDHRHYKLYAAIDTSARYLPDELRKLFSGLWIFHAPFLSLMVQMIFDPDIENPEELKSPVYDQLHQLWRRGLLERTVDTTAEGDMPMYRLLPVVRPYAERYVEQFYEREDLLRRFGKAYAGLIKTCYDQLNRSPGVVYIAQQAREDLRRGLAYVEPGSEDHGYYLLRLGWVLQRLGDRVQGLELTEAALAAAQGKYQRLELEALNNMAMVYSATGQPGKALELYEMALPIRRAVGDRAGEATTLNGLASLLMRMERYQDALPIFEESIALERQVQHYSGEVAGLVGLSLLLYQHLDQPQAAAEALEMGISILERIGLPQDAAGQTPKQLRQLLTAMRSGTNLNTASANTMPAEQVRVIVSNTVAVMTVVKERHGEWHSQITGALGQATQSQRQSDMEFFTAVLAVLDGQPASLPEGHPYAAALGQIQAGIAAGGLPDEEETVEPEGDDETPVLMGAIRAFASAGSLEAMQGVLQEQQTILFHPQVEEIFESNIRQAVQTGDQQTGQALTAILLLLRDAKANGIPAAFAKLSAAMAQTDEAVVPPDFVAQCVAALKGGPAEKMAAFSSLQALAAQSEGEMRALVQVVQTALFSPGADLTTMGANLSEPYAAVWGSIVQQVNGE
ncbi:MAG: CHAT domain-containing protein [Anaerolineae bacterium]|nr:CHAT domain-containing protein [Anaerolineae bacterium]